MPQLVKVELRAIHQRSEPAPDVDQEKDGEGVHPDLASLEPS